MKKLFNISLLLFAAVLLFSCRNGNDDIPEDIHEHEEIGKVVVTVTNKANGEIQTVNVINGQTADHLHLSQGAAYAVDVDFQIKHDDHYHSAEEIIEEKDMHFVTYKFSGADIKVKRAANDIVRTDGKKLGLKTEWTVSTAAAGKANITLVHGPTSVNDNAPSADNQLGSTVGGESDVDIFIDFH
ncbi:hypothetical protein V2E39_11025 [Chryseobacterium arthrosphaerae]|uniref:DUF4625 domain-containing protein n=1 Tax=Chryseobacterium arthrosphaerae TaxID=651561 RepID=A0ABU7QZH8_9FLAO|nr:hypothetical protein [Chryseobacterium arthrosphaerae]QUY54374.1 hypothetical protein I2F65_15980 [Chryseobacterium arthrosphaerae]